jgi:O-antigen/teichoic acid export membrane protein
VTTGADPVASSGLAPRLARLRDSRLVRQNVVLFLGGLVAGIGGFVYHAVAGRVLGPAVYGEVASLVALYAVGTAPTFILILVLARYAATLEARGTLGGIRYLIARTTKVIAVPSVLVIVLTALLSVPAAAFLNLGSPIPLVWLGVAVAVVWHVAVPRGILQGVQHFTALSLNLSLEMVVRMAALFLLLFLGLSVTGSVIAILAGVAFAYTLGMASLREVLGFQAERAQLRTMIGFSVTAAIGTLGVLLLYNLDVILAKHYLDRHGAGIYGGLNKIGTILYFLTLSVSQVMFPRVVEAVAKNDHPGRLLLRSAGIMCVLGAGAVLVFATLPGLVVTVLFGPAFSDATRYILAVGLIGLALSLDNLLIQFFMAVHDRVFIPVLAAACVLEALLIGVFHSGVGQVVTDVLVTLFLLLAALSLRGLVLMPRLRPDMVSEAP